MQDILKQLIALDGQVTSDIIKDLIDDHAPTRKKMLDLYNRYKTDDLPILNREFEDEGKINRKLNNSFDSEIVDTKVGYFIGNPISYQVDKEQPGAEKVDATLQDIKLRNNIDDLDSETVKMATICGYSARLLYIDRDGLERVMNVNPWEVILIYDRSINEPQFALRYYDVTIKAGDKETTMTRVEWYDDTTVTYYLQDDKGEYVLDISEPVNPQPHLFDLVPLIIFPNNEEMQGDAEKILNLIDAYDRTLSDVNSEIEQFRLAYMAFYGYDPDEETLAKARQTGAFGLDEKGEGVGIEFITKQMNDTAIENHLNRLEGNIMRFGKSVNMTDESFASNLSGVAIRYKLMPLENKCITLERKMTAALRQQFKVLATAWAKKGIPVEYTNIYFSFKRNLPVNLLDEAQTTAHLKGLVSERTRLSQLSFVDDVDWELEEMAKDNEGLVNLDNIDTGGGGGG
ncbi:MAG TPA: phage portal protein [Pelotomaculum sp.]|jgi:SPP1 family phage portal protein|nr:phage portal protein [Pelotomaculum sp.]